MARGINAGNRGQGSKWISRTRRQKIYERDGWKCVWCTGKVCNVEGCSTCALATLDHIVARSEGGSNATNNLVTCCMRCNRRRGNMSWFKFAYDIGWLTNIHGASGPDGLELRRLIAPIRKRIRTVLHTDWGY